MLQVVIKSHLMGPLEKSTPQPLPPYEMTLLQLLGFR